MEALVVLMVYTIVAAIGYAGRDRTVDKTVASLCLSCVNAVVTRGTRGQEAIACNYGGGMRTIKFCVCECTGHCSDRGASPIVKIEGFVCEEREVYEEVAIS